MKSIKSKKKEKIINDCEVIKLIGKIISKKHEQYGKYVNSKIEICRIRKKCKKRETKAKDEKTGRILNLCLGLELSKLLRK